VATHTREKKMKLSPSFNYCFHYIDDILSLKGARFGDFGA